MPPPPTTETHTLHCRALNIPIAIVELVTHGKVTVKEAYLLALIDALVNTKGVGCTASNSWLAVRIQTGTRQLEFYLDKLTDKGLITIVRPHDGRPGSRVIETKWSRAAEGTRAENCASPPRRKLRTPRAENCASPRAENCALINTEREKDREQHIAAVKPAAASSSNSSSNGEVHSNTARLDGVTPPPNPPGVTLARRLRDFLAKKRGLKNTVNIVSWGRSFAELLKVRSASEIGVVLDWYEEVYGSRYAPLVFSAKKFCDQDQFFKMEKRVLKHREENGIANGHAPAPVVYDYEIKLPGGTTLVVFNPHLDHEEIDRLSAQGNGPPKERVKLSLEDYLDIDPDFVTDRRRRFEECKKRNPHMGDMPQWMKSPRFRR